MSFAHPIRHTCCGKLLIFVDFLRERLSTDTTLFTTKTDTHHANSTALTNIQSPASWPHRVSTLARCSTLL